MAKTKTPDRIGELEDEIKRRDQRIAELRDEVGDLRLLIRRLRKPSRTTSTAWKPGKTHSA